MHVKILKLYLRETRHYYINDRHCKPVGVTLASNISLHDYENLLPYISRYIYPRSTNLRLKYFDVYRAYNYSLYVDSI